MFRMDTLEFQHQEQQKYRSMQGHLILHNIHQEWQDMEK